MATIEGVGAFVRGVIARQIPFETCDGGGNNKVARWRLQDGCKMGDIFSNLVEAIVSLLNKGPS